MSAARSGALGRHADFDDVALPDPVDREALLKHTQRAAQLAVDASGAVRSGSGGGLRSVTCPLREIGIVEKIELIDDLPGDVLGTQDFDLAVHELGGQRGNRIDRVLLLERRARDCRPECARTPCRHSARSAK